MRQHKKIGVFKFISLILMGVFLLKSSFAEKSAPSNLITETNEPEIVKTITHNFNDTIFAVDSIMILNGVEVFSTIERDRNRLMMLQISSGIESMLKTRGKNQLELRFKQLAREAFRWDDPITYANYHSNLTIFENHYTYINGEFDDVIDVPIVNIVFSLDEEGNPQITTPEGNIRVEELQIKELEDGFTQVLAEFEVRSTFSKAWEQGEVYNASQHRKLIEEAYINLWYALDQHNWQKVKEIYHVALMEAWRLEPNMREETIYSMISPEETVKELNLELLPMIPIEEYKVDLSEDGRLIRLYREVEGVKISPIAYRIEVDGEEDIMSIVPFFSVREGEVILSKPF